MLGGLLDDLETGPAFRCLTTRGHRRHGRWLRHHVPRQVFSREHDAFACLIGIDAKHCSNRDKHAVRNATETGTESHFVVTQSQTIGGTPTTIEHDLAVTDKRPRNLHTGKFRIDDQVGREAAIANPLVQGPQQVRATRTTDRGSCHLNRGRYRRPRRTPAVPRWSG